MAPGDQPEVRKLDSFSTKSPSINGLSTSLRVSETSGSASKLTPCPGRKPYVESDKCSQSSVR